jgi:threonine synthase
MHQTSHWILFQLLKDPDTAITQCKDTMININPVMEEVKNAILDNM